MYRHLLELRGSGLNIPYTVQIEMTVSTMRECTSRRVLVDTSVPSYRRFEEM